MNSKLRKTITFAASVLLGTGAAIAFASTSVHRQPAPVLLPVKAVPQVTPAEVIRLDPVVVIISSARYTAIRQEMKCDTEVASNPARRSRA